MNELPPIDEQAKNFILSEPSPFTFFDETDKELLDEQDPYWEKSVFEKFNWVSVAVKRQNIEPKPSVLALVSDNKVMENYTMLDNDELSLKIENINNKKWSLRKVKDTTVLSDYKPNFSWRNLYHKLCFEQMLDTLSTTCNFPLMYEYINKLGTEIPVLRVSIIEKTKLKSNHYWLMAVIGKMSALKVLKLHLPTGIKFGGEGFKFLLKGFNYMHENGRMLDKIYFNRILGQNSEEYLYPCLKQQTELQVLNFNGVVLNINDAKAIGKVLTDFKQIRELNLTDSGLVLTTVKEIADGLMRAKQLEVLKVGSNTQMGRGVNTLIYNLAFSPKIRYIDLSNISGTDAETAEAIYKLIKISGAVQTLILQNSSVVPQLTEDFYKALGENKTLEYINLDTNSSPGDNNVKLLGKAIAMNARKNGSLKAVSIRDWFVNYTQFDQFLSNMSISDQDHEHWYGDKKEAEKMEKD